MGKRIREGWGEGIRRALCLCAAAVAVVCLLGLLPAGRVQAKTQNNITFKPLKYDQATNTFTIEISTTQEGSHVVYYVYRAMKQYGKDFNQMFQEAVKQNAKAQKVEAPIAAASYIVAEDVLYAWLVDAEGNRVGGKTAAGDPDGSYHLSGGDILYDAKKNFENNIIFTNGGDTIAAEEVAPVAATLAKGILTWTADKYYPYLMWVSMVAEGDSRIRRSFSFYSEGSMDFLVDSIEQTGTYTFYWGRSKSNGVDSEGIRDSKADSYVYQYTRPSAVMPSLPASAVSWVDGKAGVLQVSLGGYEKLDKLGKVGIELYQEINEVSSIIPMGSRTVRVKQGKFEEGQGTVWTHDFSSLMTAKDAVYKVKVKLYSNDIEAVAHGTLDSVATYSTKAASDLVNESLKDILKDSEGNFSIDNGAAAVQQKFGAATADADKAALVASLTTALSNIENKKQNALRVAMQSDPNVSAMVAEIEKQAGKTVTPTVDADVKTLLGGDAEAGKVSVIGAGLNATSGQTPALKLTKVADAQAAKWNPTGSYVNTVPIGLTLTGCDNATTKLKIPVRVTIPIPKGINAGRLVILHLNTDGTVGETLGLWNSRCSIDRSAGTITFTVTHFSTFVFAETAESSSGSSGGDSDDGGSGSVSLANLENLTKSAPQGATLRLAGVTTLSNADMKALLARKDIIVVMEYEYAGKSYRVTIPAGAAVDNDIPWYGPLYLAGRYGNGAGSAAAGSTGAAGAGGSAYIVKRGDTLSAIAKSAQVSLAQLAAKNPQIKNIDLILVGQSINLK